MAPVRAAVSEQFCEDAEVSAVELSLQTDSIPVDLTEQEWCFISNLLLLLQRKIVKRLEDT